MVGRDILIALAIKYKGDFEKLFNAIKEREEISDEEGALLLSFNKANVLTILDEDYPHGLKVTYRPPIVLFYYGDIKLIKEYDRCLAVIGSRDFSEYGKNATNYIIDGLQNKKIIVSGLARGIDAIAHERALYNKGKTVAVLGSGIDRVYPIENKDLYEEIKKSGLVISEYPGNTSPNEKNFPERNRIIAGLSKGILVSECHLKSGTSITVGFGLHYGRDIYVVPYPYYVKDSNSNQLIKDGALMCCSAEDILEGENL